MEDDPDSPEYRYPQPGERYWHQRQERWVIVREDSKYPLCHLVALGEVPVLVEDTGAPAIAKLYNLIPAPEGTS